MYRRKEHLATLLYIVRTCTLTVSSLLATYTSLVYPPCRDVARYKIVGCPKGIDDKKYERNVFIFNFVFVFDSSTDTTPYEPVIQKLGDAFQTYEVCQCLLPPTKVHAIGPHCSRDTYTVITDVLTSGSTPCPAILAYCRKAKERLGMRL